LGLRLISCGKEADVDHPSRSCPKGHDREIWTFLFEKVAQKLDEKNQPSLSWKLTPRVVFSENPAKAAEGARNTLADWVKKGIVKQNFETANQLAEFAIEPKHMILEGVDWLDKLKFFQKEKLYNRYSEQIIDAIHTLIGNEMLAQMVKEAKGKDKEGKEDKKGFFTEDEISRLFDRILQDKKIPVDHRASAEEIAYEEDLFN
jgi:hypothetical protein